MTAEAHAVIAYLDPYHTTARGDLVTDELATSESCRPPRPERAMRRPGDRILVDADAWPEAPRHEVEPVTVCPRGHDDGPCLDPRDRGEVR